MALPYRSEPLLRTGQRGLGYRYLIQNNKLTAIIGSILCRNNYSFHPRYWNPRRSTMSLITTIGGVAWFELMTLCSQNRSHRLWKSIEIEWK